MKKTLLITSIILLTTVFAQGQSRSTTVTDATGPIVRFYPNPATSFITFDFQKAFESGYSIQVYNFIGKKVHDTKNMAQRTIVNLNEYNRGVYIYQLRDRTGRMIESGKFQVSR